METRIQRLQQHINSIILYLKPLLPLASCHMVNFLTETHWNLLPIELRKYLDDIEFDDAVGKFWTAVDGHNADSDTCEIAKWVKLAQAQYLTVNNDYCISSDELQCHINAWGGASEPEIKLTQFMGSKKSYEVQMMSSHVASLHKEAKTTHCVEAGGGKGNLLVALSLGYNIPSLTVDCDTRTLANAEKRVRIIQKQWRAIAKKIQNGTEQNICEDINTNLHKFAKVFITKDTDLAQVVREQFNCDEVKLLLTGLHTCGNLGPNSLRIFASSPTVGALFNVPCCYHILTEEVDEGQFDFFQKQFGDFEGSAGFPMSQYLRGFNLGRNARMLASQSIHRVAAQKQMPHISLLYRAMLQKIIRKHLPASVIVEGKLKGIADNCQNFNDYFKMADRIMKLGLYDRCQNDLTDLTDIDCQWRKIVLFNFMRLCLAQVIETVILLDRVMFLYESGFSNAIVVKLFDPVMSPRCHGIVAVR